MIVSLNGLVTFYKLQQMPSKFFTIIIKNIFQ